MSELIKMIREILAAKKKAEIESLMHGKKLKYILKPSTPSAYIDHVIPLYGLSKYFRKSRNT